MGLKPSFPLLFLAFFFAEGLHLKEKHDDLSVSVLETEHAHERSKRQLPKLLAGGLTEAFQGSFSSRVLPYCNITASSGQDACSWDNLTSAETHIQVTANGTGCLDPDAPYYFNVYKGSKENLLIYFHGGGACWSDSPMSVGTCLGNMILASKKPFFVDGGIFNFTNPENPYRNWTIVSVSYCSGDTHVGNEVRKYNVLGRVTEVRQAGANNTMSALNWAFRNVPQPKKLVISGCSAGALGSQLWSGYILQQYKNMTNGTVRTAVVVDSYMGIMAQEGKNTIISDFNMTTTPAASPFSPVVAQKITAKNISWVELSNHVQDLHPDTPYLFIQSKLDRTQLMFSTVLDPAVESSNLLTLPWAQLLAPSDAAKRAFYNGSIELFNYYVQNGIGNAIAFLADSTTHCYTPRTSFYTENVTNADGSNVRLVDWVSKVPFASATTNISTVCAENATANMGPCPARNSLNGNNFIRAGSDVAGSGQTGNPKSAGTRCTWSVWTGIFLLFTMLWW